MRFQVDENLPAAVAELLRSAGHDAATVRDEGLAGHEDADVAVAAQREGRAVVTLDTDFANICEARGLDAIGCARYAPVAR
jgi:predicted nuclease of predicted toxin-antitoxin system